MKHALTAELGTSFGGRGGKPMVPDAWKWKLLHDVNELETNAGYSGGVPGQQVMREPFSYRLWLMVHTGLQHVTHADTLLELQLVIHNSGARVAVGWCLLNYRLTAAKCAGVANVSGQLV